MIASLISLVVSVALLVLHLKFWAPALLAHGSSSAFDSAVTISIVLVFCTIWSFIYLWVALKEWSKKK